MIVELCLFFLLILGIKTLMRRRGQSNQEKRAVAVVVLGDLGRSPRMQNHAFALARAGYDVHFVGHAGTACPERLSSHPHITLHPLQPPAVDLFLRPFLPFPLFAFLKIIEQSSRLALCLWRLDKLGGILLQNPPTIPAMPVVWAVARLKHAAFLIDWHNYGWSILGLSKSAQSFVPLYRYIEGFFGRKADAAFCVSQAMREDLYKSSWLGISTSSTLETLYDRQPSHFVPLSLKDRHQVYLAYFSDNLTFEGGFVPSKVDPEDPKHFSTLQTTDAVKEVDAFYPEEYPAAHGDDSETIVEQTLFTEAWASTMSQMPTPGENRKVSRQTKIRLRPSRPALLMSSTSWTIDEDFMVLLDALRLYDVRAGEDTSLPSLVVVITGKGDGRQAFEKSVSSMALTHVQLRTLFVPADHYWRLLASADLGISLHQSSSKLDLPMKVVDMLGVGLPALAFNFATLSELLHRGVTGDVFTTATELAELLYAKRPSNIVLKTGFLIGTA